MERHFEHQIEKLKTRVIKMCSLVDEQVEFALRAVDEENMELASLVKERDNKVDKYDVKIDKICQKIFALNQPVAMDLRLIMSSLTINSNLERIGDIAVNLAEGAMLLKQKPSFWGRTHIKEMSVLAKEMIKNSIDAFIEGNAKLAEKVVQSDDRLDSLNAENHKILIEIMKETPENIEPAVHLLVMSRQLERLGDHATNISEDVYFIVEAEMIKHNYEKYLFGEDEEDDQD
ncbi:MAG: phosphate signaling complex protein PhoU [Ignavibacteriaceae bacterium]|nr:phosphate signaling complex protein PhoU [Ignavibacteriaceae bacterium]